MIEPFTATAAVLVVDRVYDRAARARQRRALLNLLGGELPGEAKSASTGRGTIRPDLPANGSYRG